MDEDEEGDGAFCLLEEGDKENEDEDKEQVKALFLMEEEGGTLNLLEEEEEWEEKEGEKVFLFWCRRKELSLFLLKEEIGTGLNSGTMKQK